MRPKTCRQLQQKKECCYAIPECCHRCKKIYTAEILDLIAAFAALITAILAAVAVGSLGADSAGGFLAGGIGSVVLKAVGGVLAKVGTASEIVIAVIGAAAVVASIVAYIIFLGLLKKGKAMLDAA